MFHHVTLSRKVLQEDTYRGDGLNLYAYCANNPVVYDDPSGHGTQYRDKVPKTVDTPAGEAVNKGGGYPVKNWKGQEVKIPDGHIMSPRAPSFSAKPITEAGPGVTRRFIVDGKSILFSTV